MYLDFYGFSETPFSLSPNPRFIFYGKPHKEAFALLLYGIERHYGFIQLTGEVGTGKTTILRTFLSQLDEEKYRTALIFNPLMTAIDLMAAINHEFGIPSGSGNSAELLQELNRFLLEENAAGRTVVLIIDEAQNLSPELLEQVRLISNLETETEKLIQIVLAGQPELGKLLEKPELRQINQRIALRYHLQPLDREDSAGYIEHRLSVAGGRGGVSFTRWALAWLYHYSRGTPRLINILCDRALLVAYTLDRRKITSRTVALAFRDVMLKPVLNFLPLLNKKGILALVAALLVLWGYYYLSREKSPGYPAPDAVRVTEPGGTIPAQIVGEKETTPVAAPTKPVSARSEDTGKTDVAAARSVESKTAQNPSLLKGDETKKDKATVATPGQANPVGSPASELFRDSGKKTAIKAFNALASQLKTAPLSRLGDRAPLIRQLKGEAARRGLELDRFNGGLDELVRLDLPALLDVSRKGDKESYLVALTGSHGGRLSVHPSLLGRSSFRKDELAPLWSGRAYIIWKNDEKIGLPLKLGDSGGDVIRLQILLQAAGADSLVVNGVFDENTVKGVKEFQRSRKISVTGKVGPVTLIHLYRAVTGPLSQGYPASARGWVS